MEELEKVFSKEVNVAYDLALQYYKDCDDVTGIDVGYKYVMGMKTETLSVRVHVKEKKRLCELEKDKIILTHIGNIPIDVIEAVYEPMVKTEKGDKFKKLLSRSELVPIIQPGISIAHSNGALSTLGLIVHQQETGKASILSNWHNLYNRGYGKPGDFIKRSPSPSMQLPPHIDAVGTLANSLLDENGDAAIAILNDERPWRYEQYGINARIRRIRNPALDDILCKSGISTGVTYGKVDGIGKYFLKYRIKRRECKIGIDGFKIIPRQYGNPEKKEISISRDSGSVWYDSISNEGVGLNFGGEGSTASWKEHSIACFLPRVFSKLKIELFPKGELDEILSDAPLENTNAFQYLENINIGKNKIEKDLELVEGKYEYTKLFVEWIDIQTPPIGPQCTAIGVPVKRRNGEEVEELFEDVKWKYLMCQLYLKMRNSNESVMKAIRELINKESNVSEIEKTKSILKGASHGGRFAVQIAKINSINTIEEVIKQHKKNTSVEFVERYEWTSWK